MRRRSRAPPPPAAPQLALEWRPSSLREAECAVCGELLVEPARLPCGHRFCLRCVTLSVHAGTGSGCCPLCRKRCAGWLRRATLNRQLVDEPLWQHIRTLFPKQLDKRLAAATVDSAEADSQPIEIVPRKLSAPGEIRNEYQAELQRMRNEDRLLEQKQSEESEKIIRELQEQERLELLSKATKLEHDEKYARELSFTLNNSTEASQSSSIKSTPIKSVPTKDFYNHLGKTINGCKSKTLDNYILRSKEKVVRKSPPMTATSPELVSTAGRCGRFLKNFLNKKLWGFGDPADPSDIGSSSKIEPKLWEPERICPNSDHELSVNSGIVIHRNTSLPNAVHTKKIEIKDVVQHKLDSDIESEDSISQELRYFKPIQPNPISRFNGRLVKCLPVKKCFNNNVPILNNTVIDKLLTTTALEKLRRTEISNLGFKSAFVCLLSVPKSQIKTYEIEVEKKEPEKKCKLNVSTSIKYLHASNNNKNGEYSKSSSKSNNTTTTNNSKKNGLKSNNSTPKKTSPMRTRSKQMSQSYVKDNNGVNLRSRVSARLKRSISFGDVSSNMNSSIATTPCNHRVLRSNGNSAEKCNGSSSEKRHSSPAKIKPVETRSNGLNGTKVNGNGKSYNGDSVDFRIDDPSLVEEQKRIEEMLAQEKKDLALAKKLQRQLGRQVINTGYTLRTATKRQATLTELLPPAKNMRI